MHIVLFCSNRRLFVGLFAPGEVDAGEDNGGADELTDPEVFAEQQYAGAHAGEGDEVLVDEDTVRPDAGDAPSPGGEAEGGGAERRVGSRGPREVIEGGEIEARWVEGLEGKAARPPRVIA